MLLMTVDAVVANELEVLVVFGSTNRAAPKHPGWPRSGVQGVRFQWCIGCTDPRYTHVELDFSAF